MSNEMRSLINKQLVLEQEIKNKIVNKIKNFINYFEDDDVSGKCGKIPSADNWKDLYDKLLKKNSIKNGEPLIIVWGPTQTLYYTKNGQTLDFNTKVSTGSNGFGTTPDSKQTPSGLMKIKNKILGKDYEVLVSKSKTGKILGPNVDSTRVDNEGKKHVAEVLTGIMDLEGLENCNKNTFERNIYFHGTNKEKNLGSKRSNGCVRVSNNDIKKLINTVSSGTKVYIYPD